MAQFNITSPTGEKFRITAPDDATDEQVMAYAQSQNTPQAKPAYQPEFGDYAQQFAQGATFDLTDEIGSGLSTGYSALQRGNLDNLSQDYQAGLEGVRAGQKQFEQEKPLASMALRGAGLLATGVGGASTKTGAIVADSLRTGSTAARVGKAGVAGATSGGLYGFGSGEGADTAASTGKGALAGAIGGAAIPSAPAALGAVGNAIVPGVEQETAQLGQRAKDLGIDLRLDQISPSRVRKTVQKVSQEIPFSGVDRFEKKQSKQWHTALAKTIGEDSDNLGPPTIQGFRKKNSASFDEAFKGQKFNFTNMVKGDLDAIASEAKDTIDAGLSSIVKTNVEKTWAQLKSGTLSGEKLASIRSELLKRQTRMKNAAAPYIGDLIDKLDDIAEAQMPADKLQKLGQARKQYRNFKTVQPLLEKSTDGTINPTQLMNRVAASRYIDASKIATGDDELVDLARIGNQFMGKAGGSDTFQKSAFGLGAAGAGAVLNPAIAAKVGIGLGANRLFQSGINQNQSLVNRSLRNAGQRPAIEIRPQQQLPPVDLPVMRTR